MDFLCDADISEDMSARLTDNTVVKTAVETPIFIPLSGEWLDQIHEIENRSYTNPWSRTLLERELSSRDISLAQGLILPESKRLLAYSFNYVVAEELHILNLAVDPEFRALGYGRALLGHILSLSIERGASYATLEVRLSNFRAKRLYQNCGFNLVGFRKNYYQDNGEDAELLSRTLSGDDLSGFKLLSLY